jgi:predicted HicB family RNase H-like nuclease
MPPRKKPSLPALTERLDLRISAREKRAFQEAAAGQGISLSQWLRLAAWQTINDHGGHVKLVALDK